MKRNAFFLMLASAFMLSGCGDSASKGYTHSVLLTKPVAQNGEGTLKPLSGVIKEADEVSVGFKTAGQLMTILVEEGDHVRQGQLLATLDDVDYKLGMEAYKVQYERQVQENKRIRKLHETKAVSDNEFEKAIAGEEQLRIQYQTYQNKLDYTRLYAPTSGYIQSVNFAKAEMVDAGTAVFTLLDTHRMEVEVNLPLSLYQQRDNFGEIFCRLTSDRNTRYSMRTISIAPKADGMQLHRMQLAFPDEFKEMHFTAGMNVEVEIQVKSDGNQGHLLPMCSVFQTEGKSYVWTVNGEGVVAKKQVEVLGIADNGYAIVSGLSGNEDVVKAGVSQIQENEKVNVLERASETNVGGLI